MNWLNPVHVATLFVKISGICSVMIIVYSMIFLLFFSFVEEEDKGKYFSLLKKSILSFIVCGILLIYLQTR